MGNRALRVQLAQRLKELGHGKLYRGRYKQAREGLQASVLHSMLRKLQYAPGSIVNDCDGFNHRIAKWLVDHTQPRLRGKKTRGSVRVVQVEMFLNDRGRSSCSCPYGPEPAYTREKIEAECRSYILKYPNSRYLPKGQAEALSRGAHICDELGLELTDFAV